MSETKFTPGPWKVVQGGDPRDFIVTDPTGNVTCEPNTAVYMDASEFEPKLRKITLEEALANAALISASPDLYESLEEARELFEMIGKFTGGELTRVTIWREKAETAIRKAIGEAS